jgi:mannose-1-phosphate guanylyltransferase
MRIPPGRAVSFEREVFPAMIGQGLYGYMAAGYWIDIGTPERYLEATYDLLAGRVESDLPPRDETASLISDGCITSGARIGPLSVLGRHCWVGDRSIVERAVLHDSVFVGHDCSIVEAIVGEGARIEDGARVEPQAVVGAGATVAAGSTVERGARLAPRERVG